MEKSNFLSAGREILQSVSNHQKTAGYVTNLKKTRISPHDQWQDVDKTGDDIIKIETSCSSIQYTFEKINTHKVDDCSVDFVAVGQNLFNLNDFERFD